MATYYIGADVHSNNTDLAIEERGRIVARYSVPTSIPSISAVLNSIQGKKILAMEEGPMAGWLYRNLHEKVDKLVVSEPRRNKLISSEGDRDDKIDSGKLAVLLRGNFLKAVHHTSDDHRAHLKHWINLYHDRVRDAVMGAAITAIERGDNAFKDYYKRMVSNGITPANARHSVARKMVSTMSAMWKTGNEYDEKLL
jgi:hypothetical protein